jgi:hypothetical protein
MVAWKEASMFFVITQPLKRLSVGHTNIQLCSPARPQ